MIRQIHAEGARSPVSGKVADLYLMGGAFQINCAAGKLQGGDITVRGHFPGGAFIYGNICNRVCSGHGRFTGPDASSVERNIRGAALVAEVTVPG